MRKAIFRAVVAIAGSLALGGHALGEDIAYLVKRVNPEPLRPPTCTTTQYLNATNISYILAGLDLWSTDGTSSGTTLLDDSGTVGGEAAVIGDTVYYIRTVVAPDEGPRGEIWASDGTAPGTRAVLRLDVVVSTDWAYQRLFVNGDQLYCVSSIGGKSGLWHVDPATSRADLLVEGYMTGRPAAMGAKVFVWVQTPSYSQQLRVSAATGGGATTLMELAAGFAETLPPRLFHGAGLLFFWATDAVHGPRVWRTDGTAIGTFAVQDVRPCSDLSGNPRSVLGLGSGVFFPAADPDHGCELWGSDGTPPGTHRITDLAPGLTDGVASDLTNVGDLLFFSASDGSGNDGIWSSDGTTGGTRFLAHVTRSVVAGASGYLVHLSHAVVFSGDDQVHGQEPWVSDGTPEGTVLLADVCPGTCSSVPADFASAGGVAYFSATANEFDRSLWKTDLTSKGTVKVAELCDVAACGDIHPPGTAPGTVGNVLIYSSQFSSEGCQLWRTDGNASGTFPLVELGQFSEMDNTGPGIGRLMNANGVVLVQSHNEYGVVEWWSSDGSDAGTTPYPELGASTVAAPSRDRVFAAGSNTLGTLVLSDPVTHVTDSLARFDPVILGGSLSFFSPSEILPFRGGIVFDGFDSAHGIEPWLSDGTAETTNPLEDIVVGPGFSTPRLFTQWNDGFVFTAEGPTPNRDLWRSDGTRDGTTLLLPAYAPTNLVPASNQLFILSCRQDVYYDSCSLYETDGKAVTIVATPARIGRIRDVVPLGSAVLFRGRSDLGQELWRSDGTWAGTAVLRDIWLGTNSSAPSNLTQVGASIFFSASDDTHGRELWKTDGTTAGTTLVKDIVSGLGGSDPQDLVELNGLLYFTAWDVEHGRELWSSDGTATGTRLAADIWPGPHSSRPHLLTPRGNLLFFAADDGRVGTQLWALEQDLPGVEADDAVVTSGAGAAQVWVSLSQAPAQNVTVRVRTYDGTARAGLDYAAISELLTLRAGSTVPVMVSIPLLNAQTPSGRWFFVELAEASGAAIGRGTARISFVAGDARRPRVRRNLRSFP